MSNIEDDVKRCNELIKVEHANWIGISNQLAISRILSDYTRQKQINEEHQKINGELREKVKGLEEVIEMKQKFIIMANEVIENSIPKQVVIDKIEEIFTVLYEKHENDYADIQDIITEVHGKIKQELLGGESK